MGKERNNSAGTPNLVLIDYDKDPFSVLRFWVWVSVCVCACVKCIFMSLGFDMKVFSSSSASPSVPTRGDFSTGLVQFSQSRVSVVKQNRRCVTALPFSTRVQNKKHDSCIQTLIPLRPSSSLFHAGRNFIDFTDVCVLDRTCPAWCFWWDCVCFF